MASAAAAAGGGAGVLPAAVRVQVRRLQPVLPGARGRAAGRAGDHRVLPGGVAVQVRQPALHAVNGPSAAAGAKERAGGQTAARPAGEPVWTRAQPAALRSCAAPVGAASLRRAGVARLRRAWAGSVARVVATYHTHRPARRGRGY